MASALVEKNHGATTLTKDTPLAVQSAGRSVPVTQHRPSLVSVQGEHGDDQQASAHPHDPLHTRKNVRFNGLAEASRSRPR